MIRWSVRCRCEYREATLLRTTMCSWGKRERESWSCSRAVIAAASDLLLLKIFLPPFFSFLFLSFSFLLVVFGKLLVAGQIV